MTLRNFVYSGFLGGKQCAFCGTTLSVKYIVTLETNFPKDSIVQEPRVWACNMCVGEKLAERKF